MSVLPPIKRFTLEDYSTVTTIPAFCAKLFYPLNLFMNATYSALNNGLTIQSNMIGQIAQVSSITSNSSGIATTTVNWNYPQTPPIGVVVMNCTVSGQGVMFPLTTWNYNAGVVKVSFQFVTITTGAVVTDTAKTYNLTLLVSGG